MGEITDKIKIESDIFALKRDYKYALENLTGIKKETVEIINAKDRVEKELDLKQEELKKVLNDISQEKLDWAAYRHSELQELENKKSEAENVIKRKGELNEQEEVIRKIEVNNIEVRNETRRLELKIKSDETALEARERELEEDKKKHEADKVKLSKDKENFKNKVVAVLKEVETL